MVFPVYGALIGTQRGRDIEIFNSFEFVVTAEDLDEEFFQGRAKRAKVVIYMLHCGVKSYCIWRKIICAWSF